MKALLGAIVLLVAILTTGCSTPKAMRGDSFSFLQGDTPEAVFGTQLPVESAEEAIARGDRAMLQGKPDLALFEYVRAVEFNPKDAETFFKIGHLHRERGDSLRSETAFRLSLSANKEHAGAQEALGLMLIRQRRYDEARGLLEGALRSGARRWQSLNGLGILDDLEGNFSEAGSHYEAAVAVNPGNAQLRNNLGYSYYLQREWDKAEQEYRRALQLDPNHRFAWQNLGQLHARSGKYDQAVEAFANIMEKAEAYNNVGYLCMAEGKYKEADFFLRKAAKTSPHYYVTAYQNMERLDSLRKQ